MVDEPSKAKELEEILKNYEKKDILIPIRGAPDPDSIAAALATRRIAKNYGVNCDIVSLLPISHQENIALEKMVNFNLGVQINSFDPEKADLSKYSGYCLVDSHVADIEVAEKLNEAKIPLISVVDHHEIDEEGKNGIENGNSKAEFIDIRPNVGSTATIYAEYLRDLDILGKNGDPEKKNSEEDNFLATVVAYGIRNDTKKLLPVSNTDLDSLRYLNDYVNWELVKDIENQSLSPGVMDKMVAAYNNMESKSNYCFAFVGALKKENSAALPQAADFILRRDDYDTVIVYGIVGDQVIGSMRTSSSKVDPGKWINDAFKEEEDILPHLSGGGKYTEGGFNFPISCMGPFRKMKKEKFENNLKEYIDGVFKNNVN